MSDSALGGRGSPQDAVADALSDLDGESGPDIADLRTAGAKGVKWSLVQAVGTQLVRLAFTFVLVRIVGPDDFGVVAEASIYIALTMVVLDQGFGAALVQRKVLDQLDIGTVAWLNLITGLTLAGATLVLAEPVAEFFDTPELTAVLRVLSISVLVKSFQLVPRALARRRLLFREQAVLDLGAVAVSGVAGVAAAVLGADYWALVVQTVVYDALTMVGLNAMVGRSRTFRGSTTRLRPLLAFSLSLLGSRFLTFFGQNFDNLLIARFESARQLAFYALSYRLLRMPLQMIGGVANSVSLPVFARLQDDIPRLRSWFLRSTSLVALLSFPVLTLLVVGARDGVPFVFGQRWSPAVAPLMILCVAGSGDVVRMLMTPVAQARNRTDQVFWWALATFSFQGAAFVVGVQFGIVGVSWAYALSTALLWPLNVAHFGRTLLGMDLRQYGASLAPAFVASLALAGTWLVVEQLVESASGGALAQLVAATVAGLVVYVATLWIAFPRSVAATREVAELMTGRQR